MVVINGKKILSGGITTALLGCLLGLILLIWPGGTLIVACRVIGIALIAAGLISSVSSIKNMALFSGKAGLVGAIVLALVGLFIIVRPELLASVIPFAAGLWLIFHGGRNIVRGVNLMKLDDKSWWIAMIFGIVSAVLGFVLFSNPFQTASLVVRLIGLFFLFDGVTNIWSASHISKARKAAGQGSDPIDVDAKIEDV